MVRGGKTGVRFWKKEPKDFSDAVADSAGGTNTCSRKSLLLLFFRKEDLSDCMPIWDSADGRAMHLAESQESENVSEKEVNSH
jgi:hypothetical protein